MAELVVALDLSTADDAEALVDRLPDLEWVKVGPILFVQEGPTIVDRLKQRGLSVFLDLKWYDIPNTVAGAVTAAAQRGVDLATVHALGGAGMLDAAAAASGPMELVAVTVLTSYGPDGYWNTVGRKGVPDLGSEVGRLAELAIGAGVEGVVASPLEVPALRSALGPDPLIVTPGIRPSDSNRDDQRRTAEPASAVRAGATHLVVGRPITRAEDPAAVYDRIRQEMRQAN